jgi:hypothetical protein
MGGQNKMVDRTVPPSPTRKKIRPSTNALSVGAELVHLYCRQCPTRIILLSDISRTGLAL